MLRLAWVWNTQPSRVSLRRVALQSPLAPRFFHTTTTASSSLRYSTMSDSESEAFDLISTAQTQRISCPITKKVVDYGRGESSHACSRVFCLLESIYSGSQSQGGHQSPQTASTKAAPKPRVASGTAKKTNPLKMKNGTDMDMDSKDDSDIDAGSRAPKAKGKAKAVREDDDDAFEDEAPNRKGATFWVKGCI
jgi:hypothetical protein